MGNKQIVYSDLSSIRKILILTHEFMPFRGGVATYVHELALAAHQLGHHMTVLAPNYGKDLTAEDLRNYPYSVIRYRGGEYNIRKFPSLLWRTMHEVDFKRYDLVHAADWVHIIALSCINKFRRVPFIATVHGSEILEFPKSIHLRVLRVKNIFNYPDKILSNSHYTRNLLLTQFPNVDRDKVKVTLLAASSYWFQTVNPEDAQRVRRTYNIPLDHKIILTVSRLDKRKGHRLVFQALQLLPAALKEELTYVIVGDGVDKNYLKELRRLAAGCGVNVVFTGSVSDEDVRALYSTAAVFCMPGEPHDGKVEGFGLVYLEAAAQGLPSIASNMAAIPEVVLDGKTGLLVQPMDVPALASALERLLGEPVFLRKFKQEARKWAKTFSWERCARESYVL